MASPDTRGERPDDSSAADNDTKTLKYHLLGPSLTKAGQDKVDQSKVSEIIYNASKGSKYFNREEVKDKVLTQKIENILARKSALDKQDLSHHQRNADRLIGELELTRDLTQHVVHVDCDAFYAAVEQLDRPELDKIPFAVGGGVLTTCNYVARKFGCRSGMAGFVAKKLCPELVLIKPNFQKYTAKASEVREIIANYDPRFESASIDEAYLNITDYCRDKGQGPAEVVDQMRREIHQKTQITVSAGIAPNSKLAKICSNMNKPNGQYVIPNDRTAIMMFMRDLPTRKVNGIGRVLERELLEIGIVTCGDIHAYRQYLHSLFGEKTCNFLLTVHLGLGRTRIQPAEEYERKSVGTESTFHDMSDVTELHEKLRWTAEELEKDMQRAECKGRTLCLKVKLHTFEVYTRQVVTPRAIANADDLYNYALPMMTKLRQEFPNMRLRLMGLRCTHLIKTKRPDTMAFFGFRPRSIEQGDLADQEGSHTPDRKRKATDDLDGEDTGTPTAVLRKGHGSDDSLPQDLLQAEMGFPGGLDLSEEYQPERLVAREDSQAVEEQWDCPICARPQAADERTFNEHIDMCLSRQTIRDALQAESSESDARPSSVQNFKRSKTNERKGGKQRGAGGSSKQKTLSFG